MRDDAYDSTPRRTFLVRALQAGAAASLGSLGAGCASEPVASGARPCAPPPDASFGADGARTDAVVDVAAAADAPRDAAVVGPRPDVAAAGMPYRQDDPAWGADLMWDRDLVIRADHELNGEPLTAARALLRNFSDGNSIGNEGCLLTSLAMVLRLFAPATPTWTPRTLNQAAQDAYYYTACGLSMTTLYADLVSEVSGGAVQLAMKEEYLAGEPGWPKVHVHTSALVRAWRGLGAAERADLLVVLKTGTYDDTVASHYLLLHPDDAGTPDDPDPLVLDPAKPVDETRAWRLSDSARTITQDAAIARGWAAAGIEPTQIGGAWVFVRWDRSTARPRVGALAGAWARELTSSGS